MWREGLLGVRLADEVELVNSGGEDHFQDTIINRSAIDGPVLIQGQIDVGLVRLFGDFDDSSAQLLFGDRLAIDVELALSVEGDIDDICGASGGDAGVGLGQGHGNPMCAHHQHEREDEEGKQQEDDIEEGGHLDAGFVGGALNPVARHGVML